MVVINVNVVKDSQSLETLVEVNAAFFDYTGPLLIS